MDTSPASSMELNDYPALFRAANTASVRAQAAHFFVLKMEMYLLIIGALLGTLAGAQFMGSLSKPAFVGSVLALLIGLCISLVARQRNYEQQWFNGRAIAETVKSLAWRYMTRAPPLQQPTLKEADAGLGAAIVDLLQDWKDRLSLAPEEGGSAQRTPKMRDIREKSVAARLDAYRAGRLSEQQQWYSRRAREHDRSESRWYALATLAQMAALATAVLAVAVDDLPVRPIGVVATIASAAFAWSKAKRFRELSSAYSMAAQELAIAESESEHVASDEELANLVQEVEERISREHKTWRARAG